MTDLAGTLSWLKETFLNACRRLPQGHVLPRPAWTQGDHKALYTAPPSVTDELPWMAFDPEYGVIVFEDGLNCGGLLELTPLPTEGRDATSLERLHQAVTEAIKDGVPEESVPWVVQFYVHDEPSLLDIQQALERAIPPEIKATDFTRHWLDILDRHFEQVVSPQGLFEDQGRPWRGKRGPNVSRSPPGASAFTCPAR